VDCRFGPSLARATPVFFGNQIIAPSTTGVNASKFMFCNKKILLPGEPMSKAKKNVNHHIAAAKHHSQAAHHHSEAARHYDLGAHDKAAHHAQMAHGHGLYARRHAESASQTHAEIHDESFPWSEWIE
jgi:hypothetical protein